MYIYIYIYCECRVRVRQTLSSTEARVKDRASVTSCWQSGSPSNRHTPRLYYIYKNTTQKLEYESHEYIIYDTLWLRYIHVIHNINAYIGTRLYARYICMYIYIIQSDPFKWLYTRLTRKVLTILWFFFHPYVNWLNRCQIFVFNSIYSFLLRIFGSAILFSTLPRFSKCLLYLLDIILYLLSLFH